MIAPGEIASLFYACSRLDKRQMQWFRGKGVSPISLVEPDPILRAKIVSDSRYFDIASGADDGAAALTILIRNAFGDPLDIVAWKIRGDQLLPLLGAAAVLGEDNLYAPRLATDGALPVYRSPMAWLRAGRAGVVIVNVRLAASRLADVAPLLAEDVNHGRELREALARPAPRIVVPSRAKVAA